MCKWIAAAGLGREIGLLPVDSLTCVAQNEGW